jgi:hypothetical protein
MIPNIDAQALAARDPEALAAAKHGAEEVGFLTLHNTALSAAEVEAAITAYRAGMGWAGLGAGRSGREPRLQRGF